MKDSRSKKKKGGAGGGGKVIKSDYHSNKIKNDKIV